MSPRVFTAVWIAIQLALPLHYYVVRAYDDYLDEAFAWRMFSDTHHGASYVNWYTFDGNEDKGVLMTYAELVRVAGLSKQWASFVTGNNRGHTKAPPFWVMRRTAVFLCGALKHGAIGVRSSGIPWVGDVWDREFVWECK